MKHLIYILVFAFAFESNAYSQMIDADYILGGTIERRPDFISEKTGGSTYRLSFDFGESVLMNQSAIRMISSEQIIRIDFVYSRFKETSEFDQRALNTKRIDALMKAAPFIFYNTSIDWHVIEIAAKPSKEENEKLFHGFVIYARPTLRLEDGKLVASSKPLKEGYEARILTTELKKLDCYRIEKQMKVRKKKSKGVWTGNYLPKSYAKRKKGVRYDSKSIWGRQKEYLHNDYQDSVLVDVSVPDTSCACLKDKKTATSKTDIPLSFYGYRFDKPEDYEVEEPVTSGVSFVNTVVVDTIVGTVLNRNKSWKKIFIVEDVTGSMYPYTMQTLAWRKLNDKATRASQFVFFNDGDQKPDGPIGRSGGAYYAGSRDNAVIEKACTTTMSKGGGGQGPENNIEALIFAQSQNKEAAEIVMIADNWAPVRDLSLLDQLTVPVHIILCGAIHGNINVDYLNIALATGGSVHTIEEDFVALSKMTEGEVLSIGKQKYKIKDGRFALVRN
ncbi:MAG: hypothetical protein ACKVOK_10815 [Flavobacteriales bacterium]